MYRYLLYLSLIITFIGVVFYVVRPINVYPTRTVTIEKGKDLFTKQCISCHGLEEDGFGPPLGGVTKLLSKNELVRFIKNPAIVIESGDERANWLHTRYKQMMPSFSAMNESEIVAILAYIHDETIKHAIQPHTIQTDTTVIRLAGRLVNPVAKSDITVNLEELIQIPLIDTSSSDLGIVTLRTRPDQSNVLYVSDQHGIIYKIKEGEASVFLEVRDFVPDFQFGPGIATGVASFEFHPDFEENRLLYLLHAETYKGQTADYSVYADSLKSEVQWVLSEWKMDKIEDDEFSGTYRNLLRLHAPTFAHGAQDIGFIPGLAKDHPEYGLLYFSFGDGGTNNIGRPELGHKMTSFLGSIFRIDPAGNNSSNGNYGIPIDNPYVNESDPATVKEIYANGFRNPHRITWDPVNNNRMMATDIGEANIEEINIIENGGDYGWPSREGTYGITTTVDLKTVYELPNSDQNLYRAPFAQYDHEDGNAISGGYVYDGDIQLLQGKYIFGDIVNGKLFYTHTGAQLKDSTILELSIAYNGMNSDLKKMTGSDRLHLRVAYDRHAKQLYVITKTDGRIWKVTGVN